MWSSRNLLSIALLAGLGCGGGSTPGSSCCAPACGGDVVGRWMATGACVDEAALKQRVLGAKASCGAAAISNVSSMAYGEIAFAADSTYTVGLVLDLLLRIDIPRSCVGGTSCTSTDTSAFLTNLIGSIGVGSIACGGDESCFCNESGTLKLGHGSTLAQAGGTYSTSGSTLSLASTTGMNDSGSYCVQGSELHLTLTGMSDGMSIIPSNLVFTKL